MIRTVVALPPDDKDWLDREAVERGVPMTQLVREAVKLLRVQSSEKTPGFEELLDATQGTWRHGDGLAHQNRLRDEW